MKQVPEQYVTCPHCKGTGVNHEPDYSTCSTCEGNGSVPPLQGNAKGSGEERELRKKAVLTFNMISPPGYEDEDTKFSFPVHLVMDKGQILVIQEAVVESLLLEAEKRGAKKALESLIGLHTWNGSPPRRYQEEGADKLMYDELMAAIDQTLTRIMEGGE